ncbi:MAG: winged helix-turn-helix domain-containing protein [Pseudomonadota bacterium]|nr:winged helix-turn-helix domain-containing protein [Polaromonas sp.]MDQ3272154.1 winged helix-turn-helix domain-containing protein [Pseudomonadota bacterium]
MMMRHLADSPPLIGSPGQHGYTARDDGFVCLHGIPLHLPPKERAVLHLLLSRWPDVVPKEEFASRVWRSPLMSDESLARCVAQLRPALETHGGISIRSVYRTGYRLTVQASEAGANGPGGASVATTLRPLSRLVHEAMAQPRQVATLVHARQLSNQRTRASMARAELLLRELVAQAPDYLSAKLGLAECVAGAVSCGLTVPRSSLIESLTQLRLIEEQAPHLPGLHAEMAHLHDCLWQFTEAGHLHNQAASAAVQDDQIHHYRAWHQWGTGQARAAAESLQRALELNPFSVPLAVMRARCLAAGGELAAGLTQARQLADSAPDSAAAQIYLLGYRAFVEPRAELIGEAEHITLGPGSWAFAASTLAYVFARCGAREQALSLMRRSTDDGANMRANYIGPLLCLDKGDEAMALAMAAAQLGCGQLPLIVNAAENSRLRSHPGFSDLRARMDKP